MIRGVLDLSAIEAGHVAVRTAAVEVRGVAAACLALIRPAAEAKGLRLTLNTAPDVPCRIMADPARLRQILLNLLGNAAKFTSSGSVELRLRLAGGGAMLRAEVADTGQGIPAAQRHRLFQDFERLGSGVSGQAEGAGLGLAISARLAALMGGRLGHLDNLGGGSIFWLDLPLADCPEPADAPAAPPVQPAPAPGVAMRVLVADDDGMSRDIAASFLRAAGHCAATAAGGTEAAEAAAAADFDAVLMDVHMAGMDGIEATRRIRALDGRRGRVPIIAMTASAFAEQVRECLESGMDGHVAKPFTRESLAGALECAAEAGRRRAVRDAEAAPSGPLPPVLDIGVFERTAAVLTPDDVRFHMGTLAARGEALLHGLRGSSPSVATGGDLAEAAHALAGSAGLFGFARLASVARRFEDAAESLAAEVPTAARDLAAALETALDEMHSRGPALMEA